MLDKDLDIVVKVGENQPCLLGVDVLHALGIDLLLSDAKFAVTMKQPPNYFKQINFETLMHTLKVTPTTLKPVHQLKPIAEVVREMLDTGTAHCAVDMGTTCNLYLPSTHTFNQ